MDDEEEEKAAVNIQKHWRGKQVRNEIADMKRAKEEKEKYR